ncbi:hypothetical protein CERSUDRAFT_118438 [Gelatoporia subvermispora B]|uniref:Uncharacterized protein n=1 Tax=Ceriporiopsis subvermispora (strain B) TaxID=914234 RepID=M2R4A6_CERS8|nr:hypothetical protein CERSUDRAFT_118438 [Gelatoporia subvermispora B]
MPPTCYSSSRLCTWRYLCREMNARARGAEKEVYFERLRVSHLVASPGCMGAHLNAGAEIKEPSRTDELQLGYQRKCACVHI